MLSFFFCVLFYYTHYGVIIIYYYNINDGEIFYFIFYESEQNKQTF